MLGQTAELFLVRYRRTAFVARDDDRLADARQGVFLLQGCLMPGRVYSCCRAAAVAKQELTPGTMSNSMFFLRKASICS